MTIGASEAINVVQPAHGRATSSVPYDLHATLGAKAKVIADNLVVSSGLWSLMTSTGAVGSVERITDGIG